VSDTVTPTSVDDRSREGRWERTVGALRYHDYRYLWLSQVCSALAQWMDEVVRGWIAYQLTGSPLVLGIVAASRHAPLLVFGPWAGVFADRFDRRWQLVAAQWANTLVDLTLVGLLVSERLEAWHLAVLALAAGSAQSFMQPARQAMLPRLVPRSDLMSGIALLSVAFNTSRSVGPAVAGLLMASVGPVGAALGQVLVHFLGGVSILLMREVPAPVPGQQGSLWGDLLEGLRYVWRTPPLALLLVVSGVPMVVGWPYATPLPVYAKDILDIGPQGLGLLLSAVGVGAISGLLMLGYLGDLPGKGGKMLLSMAGFGLAMLVFSYSPWLAVSLLPLFGIGLFSNAFHAFVNHLLHRKTEDAFRGRVMSLYALDRGLHPFGSLIVGTLAQFLGAPAAVAITGALLVLVTLGVALRWPSLRDLA